MISEIDELLKGTNYARNFGSKGKVQDENGICSTLQAAMGLGGGNIPIVKESFMNNNQVNENNNSDIKLFITNKEFFITKGLLENNKIDNSLQNLLIERKKYESSTEDIINSLKGFFLIYPIIIDSDILGLFIFFKEKELNNQDKTLANIILKILENR